MVNFERTENIPASSKQNQSETTSRRKRFYKHHPKSLHVRLLVACGQGFVSIVSATVATIAVAVFLM